MNKRLRMILALVLTCSAVSAGAFFEIRKPAPQRRFETASVTRGDILANVVATGTLQAVKTVDVGTQASGVVKELLADFNSVVHKGEVIARLDPALIESQVDQGRANVEKAKSDVDRLRVSAEDANRQLARARTLFAEQLLDQSDLDEATVAAEQAEADMKAAEAQVNAAQAGVDQNLVNLKNTIITAPIDGIVIARNVDVGQTLVSNMQAQSIFQIAEDLTEMQVDATIDESDVGRLREGDPVRFTVDAYPGDIFTGRVAQVRLNPHIDQNVVTYDTVIGVRNTDLKLRPGMTANVTVQVAFRHDVLRVPANALRFKPNLELFAQLKQPVPAMLRADQHAGGGTTAAAMAKGSQVWVVRDNRLTPVPVQVGLSDGTNSEVVAANLKPGDAVVLNVME